MAFSREPLPRATLPVLLSILGLLLTPGAWGAQSAEGDPVTFPNPRGVILRGHLFGQGRTAVLLAHGDGGDQRAWFPFAQTLAGKGFLALAFDFEGHGRSNGTPTPRRMDGDIAASTAFLRGYGADRIFLVGAGLGGTAALRLAAREPVAGVVVLSAPVVARDLSVEGQIGRIAAPLMLVASEADAAGTGAARALAARAKAPVSVRIVPGDGRGADLLSGPAGARLTSALLAFLASPAAVAR